MILHLLQAAFLGAVQGITEFLPVSSTGHLLIFETIFHLDQKTYGLSFDMFTNLGTSLALVWFFRKDIADILRRFTTKPKTIAEKTPWWILWVTILVAAAGLVLEDTIATSFRSLGLVATSLAAFSLVMLAAEAYASKKPAKPLSTPSAFVIGLAQVLAFVPGVSRSGATISFGRFCQVDRAEAARFSFLLSIPITLAAILKRMLTAAGEFQQTPPGMEVMLFYLVGLVVAAVVGYYSIRFLLEYVRKASLAAFAYYRIGLAILLGVYLLVR